MANDYVIDAKSHTLQDKVHDQIPALLKALRDLATLAKPQSTLYSEGPGYMFSIDCMEFSRL